jgi:hypothetical protein
MTAGRKRPVGDQGHEPPAEVVRREAGVAGGGEIEGEGGARSEGRGPCL